MTRLPEWKKKKILKSKSFKKWKKYRKKSKAAPKIKKKDLLRAYQIDITLKAKEKDPEYWKRIPQRADIALDKGKETWKRKKKYYKKRK